MTSFCQEHRSSPFTTWIISRDWNGMTRKLCVWWDTAQTSQNKIKLRSLNLTVASSRADNLRKILPIKSIALHNKMCKKSLLSSSMGMTLIFYVLGSLQKYSSVSNTFENRWYSVQRIDTSHTESSERYFYNMEYMLCSFQGPSLHLTSGRSCVQLTPVKRFVTLAEVFKWYLES